MYMPAVFSRTILPDQFGYRGVPRVDQLRGACCNRCGGIQRPGDLDQVPDRSLQSGALYLHRYIRGPVNDNELAILDREDARHPGQRAIVVLRLKAHFAPAIEPGNENTPKLLYAYGPIAGGYHCPADLSRSASLQLQCDSDTRGRAIPPPAAGW